MAQSVRDSLRLSAKILLSLAVLAGGWFWIVRPLLASDEERLQTIVLEAVEAAENRRVGDLLKDIAPDYSDAFHPDRKSLQQVLNYAFFAFKAWRVEIVEPPRAVVAEDGLHAEVAMRARVRFSAQPGDPAAGPDQVAHMRKTDLFRLRCEKRDGRWWVVSCDGGAEGK